LGKFSHNPVVGGHRIWYNRFEFRAEALIRAENGLSLKELYQFVFRKREYCGEDIPRRYLLFGKKAPCRGFLFFEKL